MWMMQTSSILKVKRYKIFIFYNIIFSVKLKVCLNRKLLKWSYLPFPLTLRKMYFTILYCSEALYTSSAIRYYLSSLIYLFKYY